MAKQKKDSAEKQGQNRRQMPEGRRFQPGVSGNPNGRPPKLVSILTCIKEVALSNAPEAVLEGMRRFIPPDGWEPPYTKAQVLAMRLWMAALKTDGGDLAAKFLVEMIDGKATQKIEGTGIDGAISIEHKTEVHEFMNRLTPEEQRQFYALKKKGQGIK